MNEAQEATLRAQILRLRAEDDVTLLEDREDRVEAVVGLQRGRAKQIVLDRDGRVIECRNL